MTMTKAPDFTDIEIRKIQSAVNERFRKEVHLEMADTECRLDSETVELTSCHTVFWREGEFNFVVMKTGDSRYRCQFFGRELDMFGTGQTEYDDVTECAVSLLQVQADQERTLAEARDKMGFRPAG
uniref:Uncharacterized protein n=1 Tax=Candidatus Kentrum sp. DK TaxID=2126562 RepID=A0A450SRA8_9GAMM|nr:MAG: hypothetical protein BECKDK2373C_GA0170839_105411 [Candidatus Kentron sp. DK]